MFRRGRLTPPPEHADPAEKAACAQLWCAVLADIDDDLVMTAALRHLRAGDRESSFWPTPARLLSLVTDPGHASGTAAFGRLLHLAERHGSSGRPQPPNLGDPYRLAAAGSVEEAARTRGVEAVGGWAALCSGDRATARDRYIVRHAQGIEKYRAAFEEDEARTTKIGGPPWLRRRFLAPWHLETDAVRAWDEIVALADERGADDPPILAGERVRFRLDAEPAIERAMWEGLEAIGGWDRFVAAEIRDDEGNEPKRLGFDRHTFAQRYEATFERARQDGEYRPGAVIDLAHRLAERRDAALTDRNRGGAR